MSRTIRACKLCRSKKKKCTGGKICRRCFLAGAECIYDGKDIKKIKLDEFELTIPSGSIEELLKRIETVIPLPPSVSLPIAPTFRVLSDEIYEIIKSLDRSSLMGIVTKYVNCGYISYDSKALEENFGTTRTFAKEDITPLAIIVFAIGLLYKPDLTNEDFQISLSLYSSSSDLISSFYENVSIDNVEVLALNSWYLRAINQKKSSILVSSMSIQVAAMIGLHKLKNDPTGDDSKTEREKRVWWSAYAINMFFSVRSEHPIYLNQSLITTSYPKLVDVPQDEVILMQKTFDLSLLSEKVHDFYVHSNHNSVSLIEKMMILIEKLNSWKVSNSFFDDSVDFSKELSRDVSSMYLNFFYLNELTTIPGLLYLTIQKLSGKNVDLKKINSKMVSIVMLCEEAALSSLKIMTNMPKDSIANFGVSDVEYLPTSTLIIAMTSIISLETDNSNILSSAIRLLDDMKTYGSPHLYGNYDRLAKFLNATNHLLKQKESNLALVTSPSNPNSSHNSSLKWGSSFKMSPEFNSQWEEFINFL